MCKRGEYKACLCYVYASITGMFVIGRCCAVSGVYFRRLRRVTFTNSLQPRLCASQYRQTLFITGTYPAYDLYRYGGMAQHSSFLSNLICVLVLICLFCLTDQQ